MNDAFPPLILTLALDGASFARLDDLRRRHYPAERNRVPAHLTIFHSLPGAGLATIKRDLAAICARQRPFYLRATGWKSLDHGTALAFSSPELIALRQRLAFEWCDDLGAQDAAPIAPHVTVQNKVPPRAANALLRELQVGFRPFTARAEGLLLWRYRGGPWDLVRRYPFLG